MNLKSTHHLLVIFLFSLIYSCDSRTPSAQTDAAIPVITEGVQDESPANQSEKESTNGLPENLLGLYYGNQPSYFMKNQFGDDMVVNGNRISVPSIDHKFLFKQGNVVSLQQISLQDNTRAYYTGSYKILSNSNQDYVIQADMYDGSSSRPSYTITIDKNTGKAACRGNEFEPEFQLSLKGKDETSAESSEASPTQLESSPDGIYSYKDGSVDLQIVVRGDSWSGKTVIISGMGDEYDNPEYEQGVVRGNTLYESSGLVEIGVISNGRLTTTIGNNRVTLQKN